MLPPHRRPLAVVLGRAHQAVDPRHGPDRRLLGIQRSEALHHRRVAMMLRRQAVDGLETDITAGPGQRLRALRLVGGAGHVEGRHATARLHGVHRRAAPQQ
jgi:hypothetical protein